MTISIGTGITRGDEIQVNTGIGATGISINGAFDPNSIPGLKMNVDAQGPVSERFIFNGPDISQWTDLSGNGNHLPQPTASKQPLFVASSTPLNNFPGVRFNGSTEFFQTTGALKDIDDRTMFFVSKIVAASATSGAFYGYNNDQDFLHYNSTFVENLRHFNGATFPVVIPSDTRLNPIWLLSMTFSDTQTVAWENLSKESTTVNTPVGATASFYIGAKRGGIDARFWEGDMGQILIYDRVLTDPEVVTVQNALIPKWGII